MITEVTQETLPEAALIHSESWKKSHQGFCSEAFVALHSVEHQKEYLAKEMRDGKILYMLVKEKPVGIVSVKENLIENLYVLPSEQCKGYGSELLVFAMKQCLGKPRLWILKNNKRAYALYIRHGFCLTGKKNQLSESLAELEMQCDVPPCKE